MSYYPPAGSSYPYGAYHAQATAYHAGQPGAYPQYQYPASTYGSTWPYTAYSYYPPQQPHAQAAASTSRGAATANAATASAPTSATAVSATATPTIATAAAPAAATAATSSAATPLSTAPMQRTFSTTPYTYPSYRESYTGRSSGRKSTYRGLFTKELRNLMYGFGDDRNPANDTVNVMEEILIEYIIDVCQTSLAPGKKSRLSIEDLRRTLSRTADAKKLARMEELLFMQEDIKRARAQFEESDMNQATSFQA